MNIDKSALLILQGSLAASAPKIGEPPVAVNDFPGTNINTPVVISVLDNDSDPDGDTFSVTSFDTTTAEGGTVTNDGSGVLTYTPPLGFIGEDTFSYTITDANGMTDTATVNVSVSLGVD